MVDRQSAVIAIAIDNFGPALFVNLETNELPKIIYPHVISERL